MNWQSMVVAVIVAPFRRLLVVCRSLRSAARATVTFVYYKSRTLSVNNRCRDQSYFSDEIADRGDLDSVVAHLFRVHQGHASGAFRSGIGIRNMVLRDCGRNERAMNSKYERNKRSMNRNGIWTFVAVVLGIRPCLRACADRAPEADALVSIFWVSDGRFAYGGGPRFQLAQQVMNRFVQASRFGRGS